jgi:ankyrin repeat protein
VIRTFGSLGANLTEESDDEATVKEIAPSSGDLVTIRLLGSLGASVNGGVTTPLYMAAKQDRESGVRLLVSMGADPNEAKKNGQTPLMVADAGGHASILRYLAQPGSDVNAQTRDGETALRGAAESGRDEAMGMLVSLGAVATVPEKHGRTPLMAGCAAGRKTTVQLLASLGAELNVVEDQCSVLCVAARKCSRSDRWSAAASRR